MLVYVRHGATSLNATGSEERLRGWLPAKLTTTGQREVGQAADTLRSGGLEPASFETSDLPRAVESADIIGKKLGIKAAPNPAIRDWNTGDFAGQLVSKVMPEIHKLIKTPYQPAPGGESIGNYLDRFVPAMKAKVLSPDIHLVVGHARGAAVLEGLASPVGGVGGDVDQKFLINRPNTKPGGILIVNRDWSTKQQNPHESESDKE